MERAPYHDEDGKVVGKCLPISAHQLQIWLDQFGIYGKILCPGDCIATGVGRPVLDYCWLEPWWEESQWEMIDVVGGVFNLGTFTLEGEGDLDSVTIQLLGRTETPPSKPLDRPPELPGQTAIEVE